MPCDLVLGFDANLFTHAGDDGELLSCLLSMANHIRGGVSPAAVITQHDGVPVIATTHDDGRKVWLSAWHSNAGITVAADFWNVDPSEASHYTTALYDSHADWDYNTPADPDWVDERKQEVEVSRVEAFNVFCWFTE